MNTEQIIELESNVKSVTDRLDIIDAILAANKIGREMIMVFMCGESQLYYPADYIKNWGKLYGIGLGPHPVSESLQSEYDVSPPAITSETRDLTQIMHPLRMSCAQMDLDLVDRNVYESNRAVLAIDDPIMRSRVPILYNKQINNKRGRLGSVRAAWANLGRTV